MKKTKMLYIICDFCQEAFLRRNCEQKIHEKRQCRWSFCSKTCLNRFNSRNLARNNENTFWNRVDKTPGLGPNGDCWEWTGTLQGNGYGCFSYYGKPIAAHRFVYLLVHKELPYKKLICHSCDNPACVNPKHLWAGTHADNNNDKARKGRNIKGSEVVKSKLTDGKVRFIRNLAKTGTYNQKQIAKLFGISSGNVNGIVRRRFWKHVE